VAAALLTGAAVFTAITVMADWDAKREPAKLAPVTAPGGLVAPPAAPSTGPQPPDQREQRPPNPLQEATEAAVKWLRDHGADVWVWLVRVVVGVVAGFFAMIIVGTGLRAIFVGPEGETAWTRRRLRIGIILFCAGSTLDLLALAVKRP
jgi:hypothetical protein